MEKGKVNEHDQREHHLRAKGGRNRDLHDLLRSFVSPEEPFQQREQFRSNLHSQSSFSAWFTHRHSKLPLLTVCIQTIVLTKRDLSSTCSSCL